MQLISETDLRAVLQLPNRPYADPYLYEGNNAPYYDLSRREPTNVLSVSGSVSGGVGNYFRNNVDFYLHDGIIDWSLPGVKPDLGSLFTVQYTFSRLASGGASTSMFLASQIVSAELGPSFPYNTIGSTSVDNGFDYNALAKMMQLFVAAREACFTLSSAEIDLAEKYRRGTVQVDDTKKTADWVQAAQGFDSKYQKYLNLVRPSGQIHHFSLTSRDPIAMVFADAAALSTASAALREVAVQSYASGDTLFS